MISTTTDDAGEPAVLPTRRWFFAGALLVVEYVVALYVFDSERLPIVQHSAFGVIGQSMPLVIVTVRAMLLIGGGPSDSERAQIVEAFREPRRTWPLFAGHLFAYAVSVGITIFVFNAGFEVKQPWLWVVLWAASAICSLLLLVAAVVPLAAIRPLAKPLARAVGVGLVVGILARFAGAATSVFWRPMSRLTVQIVAFLLDLTGHEVVGNSDKLIVGTPIFRAFVDKPCSGYEGIGLITVMLGFYLFAFRKSLRFPNALLLLPIGMFLIWIANSLRIAALIVVGTWISPKVAEGGFHYAAGWLLFCIITLGLVAVSRHSRWFTLAQGQEKGTLLTPAGAFLLPLLVLIATGLVTGLFSTDFDYLYALKVATPLIPLWLFRSYYVGLCSSWSWTPVLLGFAVFVLWVALEPPASPEDAAIIPSALAEMPTALAAFWLLARVLGSVVVVPVAEELAFRGYLLRRLIDADFTAVSPKHFTVISFLVSSVAFGALHGRWLAGILAGMIYAAAQYRRGEISDAIVAHMATNAMLAAYVMIFGHWAFW